MMNSLLDVDHQGCWILDGFLAVLLPGFLPYFVQVVVFLLRDLPQSLWSRTEIWLHFLVWVPFASDWMDGAPFNFRWLSESVNFALFFFSLPIHLLLLPFHLLFHLLFHLVLHLQLLFHLSWFLLLVWNIAKLGVVHSTRWLNFFIIFSFIRGRLRSTRFGHGHFLCCLVCGV